METFPALTVERALGGLGINLGSQMTQEWAYAEAASAGCSEVRFQIAWANVERVDAPGTFDLSALDTALGLCARYRLRPLVVAAYAPPWQTVKTITVDGLHPIGSTTITTTSDVSDLQPGRDHLGGLWYEIGFGKPAYYGGIAHDVDGQVITLGAATTGTFADGAQISVNRLLYPSVDAVSGSDSAERYADYVEALAERIAAHGLTGRVELWNEPPWTNDTWDQRSRFYDNPAAMGISTWTFTVQPLVTALASRSMPAGVSLVSGGTHKSGGHGILRYLSAGQVAESAFVADAAHTYGAAPEVHWWWTEGAGTSWGAGYVNLNGSSNMAFNAKLQDTTPAAGLEFVISECGAQSLDAEAKRNFDLRHLVGAWAMGFAMVTFYSLADTPGLALVDATTHVATDSWTDIRRLMRVLRNVDAQPSRYALPTIETWDEGDWNLAVVTIGPLLIVWQRTTSSTFPGPRRLTLANEAGELFALAANDRGHADAQDRTVYVGAKPMILTRWLG